MPPGGGLTTLETGTCVKSVMNAFIVPNAHANTTMTDASRSARCLTARRGVRQGYKTASAAGAAITTSGAQAWATNMSSPPTAASSMVLRLRPRLTASRSAVPPAAAASSKFAKPSAIKFCPGSHRNAVQVRTTAGTAISGRFLTPGIETVAAVTMASARTTTRATAWTYATSASGPGTRPGRTSSLSVAVSEWKPCGYSSNPQPEPSGDEPRAVVVAP